MSTTDERIIRTMVVVTTEWGNFPLDHLIRQAREADLDNVADALRVLADDVEIYKSMNAALARQLRPHWWEFWRNAEG